LFQQLVEFKIADFRPGFDVIQSAVPLQVGL